MATMAQLTAAYKARAGKTPLQESAEGVARRTLSPLQVLIKAIQGKGKTTM